MASADRERIKLYFARNISMFNLADTTDDTLHMLLQSVQGLSAQEAMKFIQEEVKIRGTVKEQSSVSNVLHNPESVLLFSRLLAIPMFKDRPIVNYNNLYTWRKVTRTWLDHFLNFAVISFQFLGLDPSIEADETYFETATLNLDGVNLEFQDFNLLEIFQSNYRIHLSKAVFLLGCDGYMTVTENDEPTSYNWEESYKDYCGGVLKGVEELVESHISTPMASVENPHLEWIRWLPKRVKVLLDSAYKHFPFIRALGCSIPIFCQPFLLDLTSNLQENEGAFIEVSLNKY